MKITILGAGNVATQLALAFKKAGHNLVQVYNRSNDAGVALARATGALFISDLQQLLPTDVYVIAVKDDAIVDCVAQMNVTGVVVHTSGTKSMSLLHNSGDNFGIFYPLQTMTRSSKLDFKNVPILIESSNERTNGIIKELAKSISQNVHEVDEIQRQWIHLAAVFANNFTNHLLGISEALLVSHDLSFDILRPLILKSMQNVAEQSPQKLQTGPAIRGDVKTIERHLQLLADNERLKNIYQILTESIIASASQNHQ